MCQHIWETQCGQGLKKVSIYSSPKEGQDKKYSTYCTTAHISHVSKVRFIILQAKLQGTWTENLRGVQAGCWGGRGARDSIANTVWIMEKGREFQKKIFIEYGEASDCTDHKNLWKIWEYQTTYLSSEKAVCRLRSNRIKHETTDWLKIGRRVWQDCILSLFFSVYADNIMWNAELDESWAGIKTVRKNINNLRYANDTTLMAESEKELRSLLMRVRRRVEKLAWISKLRQLQSWHPVTTIYGK